MITVLVIAFFGPTAFGLVRQILGNGRRQGEEARINDAVWEATKSINYATNQATKEMLVQAKVARWQADNPDGWRDQ